MSSTDSFTSKVEKDQLTRRARLVYLAPDITTAILEGRQPQHLSARVLLRIPALPLGWAEQKALLGFG